MNDPLLILPAGVAALGLGLRRIKAKSLRQYKSKGPGVADLLNYAAVIEDGIIVCKSGAFMAAWMYAGDDLANSTEAERDQVADILNTALAALGSGWMIHVDAVRQDAPRYIGKGLSHFPDRVSAAIDQERRRYFEGLDTMYEGFYVLTATWYPPVLVQQKFVDLMFDDESEKLTPDAYHSKLLEQFKRDIQTLDYDADWFRDALCARGITPCIPPRRSRKRPCPYDQNLYKQRHKIEIMFGRIKDWRRIAMRYDRCAHTFFSALCLAASVIFYLN